MASISFARVATAQVTAASIATGAYIPPAATGAAAPAATTLPSGWSDKNPLDTDTVSLSRPC